MTLLKTPLTSPPCEETRSSRNCFKILDRKRPVMKSKRLEKPKMTTRGIDPLTLCTSALLIVAAVGSSRGQDSGPTSAVSIDGALKNDKSSFLVRSEVNHFSREYQDGESLSIRVISEAAAYLYVFYEQADGKVFMVFPNRIQTRNHVNAGEWVAIPSDDDLFRWRVGPPLGKELIKVVASRKPIESLSATPPGAARFEPVPRKQVEDVARTLSKQASGDWAEQSTPILTAAASPDGGRRTGRRFGLVIGASIYKYDDMIEQVCKLLKIPRKRQELPSCKNDAESMSSTFQRFGRLDDQRVLVGEQATRDAIEEAITKWLPAVSRPGDTVFIFHSGHGGQIPDDDGDETQADTLDEFILPYDFVSSDALKAASLLKRHDLARWMLKLAEAGPEPEDREAHEKWLAKVDDRLTRRTGITDDQFGHWLQALDGRQVVVILDICHSGGFASREKGLQPEVSGPQFNFLDRELSRLKDIGQRNVSLLAACRTGEASQAVVWTGKDSGLLFSPMTYFLRLRIAGSTGPLELVPAFEGCKASMKSYFASKEYQEARAEAAKHKQSMEPHEPLLYHDPTQAVFLRP